MYYKEKDYGVKYPDITVDNFRDLGGIVLENGRVIKDGMIFRSGELFGLSDGDKAELGQARHRLYIRFTRIRRSGV